MIRTAVGVLGAVSALSPDRTVALFEALAIANPEEVSVREHVPSAIRSEGILLAVISLLGGRPYAWLLNLTGAFGAAVFLFPDLYRRIATTFLYDRSEVVDWNDRFSPAVRAIGGLYVLLAVTAYRNRHTDTEAT